MRKLINFLSLMFVLIFILCGCSTEDSPDRIQEKAIQEIEYLDTQIIAMINRLNNISLENYKVNSKQITLDDNANSNEDRTSNEKTEENTSNTIMVTEMVPDTILLTDYNKIDWDGLKNEIELLNSSWGIILLDLYNMNISNDSILEFSKDLDTCIINIKNEDRKNSLISLAKLYSYIPKYLSDIPGENINQNIKQTKSYILNAYAMVEQKNWTEVEKYIIEADNVFKNIVNDIEYAKNNEFKTNKTYVLLKELEKSIDFGDDKIFYMKYKNVIESINTM